jgi:pseudouridylate synthase
VAGGALVSPETTPVATPGLRVGAEVEATLLDGRPVVGLETSVIGQGLPHPRNLECIERMAAAIRGAGAVPAWIGVLGGEVVVGLSDQELDTFTEPGRADKVARRDLPAACARGGLGATTVSATIWAAERAGIRVSATGGIGGVHPGERSDVSADLVELSRTPGLLVCSGPKSIVDPAATAERLEELGVTLAGYGVSRLPFFLAREAPVELEHRVDTPDEAAAVLGTAIGLDTRSTILLCNPIAPEFAMDADEVAAATRRCEERADRDGVRGRDLTPFLLACLAEDTGGRSLEANLALLESNAALAGAVSVAFAAVAG